MSWAEAKMINGSIGTSDFTTIDELIRGTKAFIASDNVLSNIPVGVSLRKEYSGDTTYKSAITTEFRPLLSGSVSLKINYADATIARATDTTTERSNLQITIKPTDEDTGKTVKLSYNTGSGTVSTTIQVDRTKRYVLECVLTNTVPSNYVSTIAEMTIDTIQFCGDITDSYIITGEVE